MNEGDFMNKSTFIWASLLLIVPLMVSGKNGNGSKSKYVQITQENLQQMVMKMSDYEVGTLLVQKQDLLGTNCRANEKKMGQVLYTLEVPGAAPKKFGIKKGHPVTKISFKDKKISSIFSKFLKPVKPVFSFPERTQDEIAIARKEMGAAFKAEIADRSWPCGAVQMESHRISLEDLKEEVEFYKDQDTKEVVCISPNGKKSKIRKPNSCEFEPILEELPKKLCDYLVYLAQSEAEDELVMGTRKKIKTNPKLGENPSIKFQVSPIKPMTPDLRAGLAISRAIVENPEIVVAVNGDHIPRADDFLSEDTIDQLEGKVESVDSFEDFSDKAKVEFTKMALSIKSIQGSSEFVQPSKEVIDMVDEMAPHVDAFIAENPNLQIDLYDFPKIKDVEETYSTRLKSLTKITGQTYNMNLKCFEHIRKPRRFGFSMQIKDVFKKPVNKLGFPKLKIKDGRFISTDM